MHAFMTSECRLLAPNLNTVVEHAAEQTTIDHYQDVGGNELDEVEFKQNLTFDGGNDGRIGPFPLIKEPGFLASCTCIWDCSLDSGGIRIFSPAFSK